MIFSSSLWTAVRLLWVIAQGGGAVRLLRSHAVRSSVARSAVANEEFGGRSEHYATIRGALSANEVENIRSLFGSAGGDVGELVRVDDKTRHSTVRAFDCRGCLPWLHDAVIERCVRSAAHDHRDWLLPPLDDGAVFYNDAQHCTYIQGGRFDPHLDDESRGLSGWRRYSTVVMLSEPTEYEGGRFEVTDAHGGVHDIALGCGDAVCFDAGQVRHGVSLVESGERQTLVFGVFWKASASESEEVAQ